MWNEEAYATNPGIPPASDTMLGFAPGLLSAMGQPVGGFNPTAKEFARHRSRDIAYQQFIARSLQSDQRAAALNQAIMSGLSRTARKEMLARIGGPENLSSLTSFALNMPGIAEWFGGSQRSIAFGSLAASTGGMQINGLPNFGGDPFHMQFAEQLQNRVMDRFTLPGGAMNLMASHGLNRDQLGGIMALASAQGAFAGLDMGKLEMADQKARLTANPDTMQKIERFLQNSAKALGNLMDVYGKLSTFELAAKAQQITGMDMSRLGNADIIQRRLGALRTTAEATGIDVQTMFDLSARAGDLAEAYGLPRSMQSQITQESAYKYRLRQQDANAGGFYFATPSMDALQRGAARDLSGMARDPLGARMAAVELMMQNRGITGDQASALRQFMSEKFAGSASVAEIDAGVQARFGFNLPGYIQAMGGPLSVLGMIDPNRHGELTNSMMQNLRPRTEQQIEFKLRKLAPRASEETLRAAMTLYSTMGAQGISDALRAVESGGDLMGAINRDWGGRERPQDMANAARLLSSNVGNARSLMAEVRQAAGADPLTAGYSSRSDAVRAAEQRRAAVMFSQEDQAMRGKFTQGNFSDAFWQSLGGLDTRSIVNIQAESAPDTVFGLKEGGMKLDRQDWMSRGLINAQGQIDVRDRKGWMTEAGRILGMFAKADVDKWRPGVPMHGGAAGQWASGRSIADSAVGVMLQKLGFASESNGQFRLRPEFQMLLSGRPPHEGLDRALLETANRALDPTAVEDAMAAGGMTAMSIAGGGTAFRREDVTDAIREGSSLGNIANRLSKHFSDRGKFSIFGASYTDRQKFRSRAEALRPMGEELLSGRFKQRSQDDQDAIRKRTTQEIVAGLFHMITHERPDDFRKFLANIPQFDQNIAGMLSEKLRLAETDSKLPAATRANIRAAETELALKGTGAVAPGETVISGFLQVIGDKAHFFDAVMKPKTSGSSKGDVTR